MFNNNLLMFYDSMLILTIILNMILILIGVAFNTLLERKVLGYIQYRKGPNKVGFNGILQPFGDAIKLYTNEITFVSNYSSLYFFISPMLMLLLMLTIWMVVPMLDEMFFIKEEFLFIFCCLAMGTYPLVMAGWSSYSNYALIGAIRAVSQMISYEVVMILTILSVIMFNDSYSLVDLIEVQEFHKYIYWQIFSLVIYFICMLAELNRSPFDLIEGESELVSGFNIEYSSGIFGMIFMAEYGMIMFASFMFVLLFLGFGLMTIWFYLFFFFINYSIIWIRGTMPRMRYDLLMNFCWKDMLMCMLVVFIMNYINLLWLNNYMI